MYILWLNIYICKQNRNIYLSILLLKMYIKLSKFRARGGFRDHLVQFRKLSEASVAEVTWLAFRHLENFSLCIMFSMNSFLMSLLVPAPRWVKITFCFVFKS